MDGADEADFLELLVANSRIGEWVDRIRMRGNTARQKHAILTLKQAVESRSTYAEEARQAGVVPLLTRMLGITEDEEVLDACSAIIAACSGPMATAGKVSTYVYDGVPVRIREGALGDGLGAKVWMVAHMLCLELAAHRQALLAGRRVLEIGSGCGVCGLAAAALGAAHVVLSDVEGPVLRNLRACMHLNAAAAAASATTMSAGAGAAGPSQDSAMEVEEGCAGRGPAAAAAAAVAAGLPSDAELFDEAEEVEDFEDMMADMVGGGGGCGREGGSGSGCVTGSSGRPQQQQSQERERQWEAGNTSVRLLDWAESQRLLDGGEAVAGSAAGAAGPNDGDNDLPPRVSPSERFPVIIGSEVMYERVHAELVAAVVKHRLAPGGCALLHCAVRELKVFEHFARECRRRGLRYRRRHAHPEAAFAPGGGAGAAGGAAGGCPFEGILGRADEYEGGLLLMAVDHADSPCPDWYRDDWEDAEA